MGFGLVRYSARASITLNQLAGWLRPKSEGARGEAGEREYGRRDRDRRGWTEERTRMSTDKTRNDKEDKATALRDD